MAKAKKQVTRRAPTKEKVHLSPKEIIELTVHTLEAVRKQNQEIPVPQSQVVALPASTTNTIQIEEWYYGIVDGKLIVSKDKLENGPFHSFSEAKLTALKSFTTLASQARNARKPE